MKSTVFISLLVLAIANQECAQVKRQGKQKEYCEQMLLTSSGSEATVACFVNFCDTCCGNLNSDCIQECRTAHVPEDHENDPEEVFIKVCAADRMRDAMKPFCDKYYSEEQERNKCFDSFCFDCCSGELKILSTSDPEVKKCVSVCMKKMQSEVSIPKIEVCMNTNSTLYCNERFNPLEKDKRLNSFSSCVDNYCEICCKDDPGCISACRQTSKSTESVSLPSTSSSQTSITPKLISSACADSLDLIDFNKCVHSYCYDYCSQNLSCTKQCLTVSIQVPADSSIIEILNLHKKHALSSLNPTDDFDEYLASLSSGSLEDQLSSFQSAYLLFRSRTTSILQSLLSLQHSKSLFLKSSKNSNKYEV